MLRYSFALLFLFSSCYSNNEFKLKGFGKGTNVVLSKSSNSDIWWNYLNENYSQKGEKRNVIYLEDSDYICAYESSFEFEIEYKFSDCSESGVLEEISLPKIMKTEAVDFVNQTYLFSRMEGVFNVWNEDSTKFEPFNQEVGCFYEIKQTEKNTIVKYYCGC